MRISYSREYAPLLAWGDALRKGVNLGTRESFADIGKTVLDLFSVPNRLPGRTYLEAILR